MCHRLRQAPRNYQGDVILLFAPAELSHHVKNALQELWRRKFTVLNEGSGESARTELFSVLVGSFRDSIRKSTSVFRGPGLVQRSGFAIPRTDPILCRWKKAIE